MAQRLKHLPAMWETWVRSLGREDPLEKEKATHSSILAWRIPLTEEPGGFMGLQLDTTAGQEATVRTGHGTTDWFQIGKGVRQGCIVSLCLYKCK